MAVADLDETELSPFVAAVIEGPSKCLRHRYAPAHGPDQARTRPSHALQKTATVDAIIVEVLQVLVDIVAILFSHLSSVVCCARRYNWRGVVLFQGLFRKSGKGHSRFTAGSGPHRGRGPTRSGAVAARLGGHPGQGEGSAIAEGEGCEDLRPSHSKPATTDCRFLALLRTTASSQAKSPLPASCEGVAPT